jgi:hypothetical protein
MKHSKVVLSREEKLMIAKQDYLKGVCLKFIKAYHVKNIS